MPARPTAVPDARTPPPKCPLRLARSVGRAFRCSYAGLSGGAPSLWSFAWQELADSTSGANADDLVVELGHFARSVAQTATRPVEILPPGCQGLCRDECLAVSIVAASQLGACPALRACAFALLATSQVDSCLGAAQGFADRLQQAGAMLDAEAVVNAAAVVATDQVWMQ